MDVTILIRKLKSENRCKLQDNLPIPTRVPTVNSEKSMFHSSKGNKGLLRNDDDCKTLFHVKTMSSALEESPFLSVLVLLYSWGEEGNDIAF